MFSLKWLLSLVFLATSLAECPKRTADQCSTNEEFFVNPNLPRTNSFSGMLAEFRCQNTCNTYGRTFDCGPVGGGDCFCKSGYARLTECGPCVSIKFDSTCRSRLPPTEESCRLKPNEELYASGHRCPNQCKYLKEICAEIMTHDLYSWIPVCECKTGYARLPNGACVSEKHRECVALYDPTPVNCLLIGESYSKFGSACQFRCNDYTESTVCYDPKLIPEAEESNAFQPACHCRKGYARNASFKCVPLFLCPKK